MWYIYVSYRFFITSWMRVSLERQMFERWSQRPLVNRSSVVLSSKATQPCFVVQSGHHFWWLRGFSPKVSFWTRQSALLVKPVKNCCSMFTKSTAFCRWDHTFYSSFFFRKKITMLGTFKSRTFPMIVSTRFSWASLEFMICPWRQDFWQVDNRFFSIVI